MKDNLKINEKFAGEVLAKVTRSDLVESLHLGHLIVLNADGSTYLSKGSPELPIYPRSAIKIIDGSWRPVAPIIMEIFKRWGVEMPDESVKIYGGASVLGGVIANI